MGDDEHGRIEFVSRQTKQVENLGLDRHVQSGGGLVGQDKAGVEHQRHGDDDALLLTAGELMGVIIHAGLGVGDADLVQDVDGFGAQLLPVLQPVGAQALLDLPSDRVHRVEHRVRLLKDHRGFGSTHVAQLFAGKREHVQAIGAVTPGKVHRSRRGGGFRQQFDDGAGGHGFAGAGFADHADHGFTWDREIHVLYGFDGARIGHEGDGQILDVGQIMLTLFTHNAHSLPLVAGATVPSPVHSDAVKSGS